MLFSVEKWRRKRNRVDIVKVMVKAYEMSYTIFCGERKEVGKELRVDIVCQGHGESI